MNDLLKRYDILYTGLFFLLMIPAQHFEWFSLLEDEFLSYRHIVRGAVADVEQTGFHREDILLVNTDEAFYEEYGGFPLRRIDYGNLAVRLSGMGAKVVAIDALFDYPNAYGEDPGTAALFKQAGNVLLVSVASIEDDGVTLRKLSYPVSALRDVTRSGYSNIASASFVKERMTRLRVFPDLADQKQDGWPFAVQALAIYRGLTPQLADGVLRLGDTEIALDRGLDFFIDWPALPAGVQFLSDRYSIPASDILQYDSLPEDERRGIAEEVAGKIVLVGDTSEAANDIFDTPVGQVWGVEVIAASIHTLLNGAPLRPAPLIVEIVVSVLLLAALLLTARIPTAPVRVLATLLLIAGYWTAGFLLYASMGVILSLFYNTLAIVVGAVLIFLRSYLATDSSLVETQRRSAESDRMLALAFQGQGQLDMAFDKFRNIPLDTSVADLIYNLALDYERKRQFNKAISVYEYLLGWNAEYRDVGKRIAQAQQIEANPMKNAPGGAGQTHIRLGGDGVAKPMLGRYEVAKELGQGAMGVVYLGEDPKIHRKVAIKTMALGGEFEGDALVEAKERFFREAESAGKLTHPNIVAIYDAGEEQDLAYIAMEFLNGHDLARYTQPDALLPLATVLDIGIQCAEALDYAHAQGVVHRDIKPSNIMYDPDTKQCKITDFGIARITDSSKTRTGTVLGTPNYMSPEQALGDRVDGRSDLFSLGVVLYQLCSGRLPFQGESMASLMYKIVNEPHVDIKEFNPQVPASIRKVIDNALGKQPDRRYQSGSKMAAHLRECRRRLGTGA
jgi:serine/threonine-protein kinase